MDKQKISKKLKDVLFQGLDKGKDSLLQEKESAGKHQRVLRLPVPVPSLSFIFELISNPNVHGFRRAKAQVYRGSFIFHLTCVAKIKLHDWLNQGQTIKLYISVNNIEILIHGVSRGVLDLGQHVINH